MSDRPTTEPRRRRGRVTQPPWIRPWGELTVHAPGNDDVFGRNVPSIHHPGSLEAQANIDLAVAAVNARAEAAQRVAPRAEGRASTEATERPDLRDLLQRFVSWFDAYEGSGAVTVFRSDAEDSAEAIADEARAALTGTEAITCVWIEATRD